MCKITVKMLQTKIVILLLLTSAALVEPSKRSGGIDSWLTGMVNRVVPNTLSNMYNRTVNAVDGVVKQIDEIEDRFKSFSNFYNFVAKNWKPIQRKVKESFEQLVKTIGLSKQCMDAFEQMTRAVQRSEIWPWQYFDASGKMPTSLTAGTMTSFGDYDLCMKIKSELNPNQTEEPILKGKYCLLKPYMSITNFKKLEKFKGFKYLNSDTNKNIKKELIANVNKLKMMLATNMVTEKFYLFHLGVCMPDVCLQSDTEKVYDKVLKPLTNIAVDVGPECDVSGEPIKWNLFNTITVLIALTFFTLSIIGTILTKIINRCKKDKEDNYMLKVISSFSLVDNHHHLFSVYKDRLWSCECINMVFIMWYNMSITYGGMIFSGLVGARNLLNSYAIDAATEPEYWWLRTTAHRDSLFMLSGVIISYDFFGKKRVHLGPLSYIKFVLEKYIRFLPKMLIPIILFEVLLLIGDGPNFNSLKSMNICPTSYWKNLLFINNFAKDGKTCVPSTFFLSAFFQLHLISPIFLIPLHFSAKWGLFFNVLTLLLCAFLRIVPKLWFGFKFIPFEVSQLDHLSDIKQSFWRFFTFTDQYIYLFIFGIIVGFVVRAYPDLLQTLTKNRYRTVPLTIFAVFVGMMSIKWSENFKNIDKMHNQLDLNSWYICGAILISCLLAWLIILYHKDNGLASSKIFNALIKLSMGFLVNFTAISFYTTFSTRSETAVTHLNQIKHLAKDTVQTLLATYVMYIVLESPFIRILDIIKNKKYPIQLKEECKEQGDGKCCDDIANHDCKNSHFLYTY